MATLEINQIQRHIPGDCILLKRETLKVESTPHPYSRDMKKFFVRLYLKNTKTNEEFTAIVKVRQKNELS